MNYYRINNYKELESNQSNTIGCVYILKFEDSVKIGKSRTLKERIICFKTKPIDLFCTESFDLYSEVEREMLNKFKPFKIKGEFFNISFDLAISELKKITENYQTINKSQNSSNILLKYLKKHPEILESSVAEKLGMSRALLSYWKKQPNENFKAGLINKIKLLLEKRELENEQM